MSNTSKIVLGLVGAAAAGVAIGLLLAPEKGSDTRKRLSETATDWADHLGDLFANAKSEVENLKRKGKKAAGEAASRYNNVTENYS